MAGEFVGTGHRRLYEISPNSIILVGGIFYLNQRYLVS